MMIPIELDKARNLKLDVNALADAEKAANLGILAMVNIDRIGFSSLRALLWAGLKWEDPMLTLERTGALMENWQQSGKTFQDLETVVVRALAETKWFPEFAGYYPSQGENGTTTAGNDTR